MVAIAIIPVFCEWESTRFFQCVMVNIRLVITIYWKVFGIFLSACRHAKRTITCCSMRVEIQLLALNLKVSGCSFRWSLVPGFSLNYSLTSPKIRIVRIQVRRTRRSKSPCWLLSLKTV